MGSHITRAATHLPPQTVLERLQAELRPHRRQRWLIIYQALVDPREAAQIAKHCGVSTATVHQLISAYNRRGVEAVETPGKGGRRNQYLTLEQERAFLQPYLARAAQGDVATVAEIQQALEAEVKQSIDPSTLYRLLARHGWRQRRAGPRTTQPVQDKQVTVNPPSVRERRQRLPPQVSRQPSSPGYPGDLTDRHWAILEPLLPPAKPGGHPRTSDLRQVINAILYLDRTGGQWRALPHDFPPWSTVWSYFRTWRNDGTWERLHTTLREQTRQKQGRQPTPSAAIIDSQSVKTSQKGGSAATTAAKK
jgi:transposase